MKRYIKAAVKPVSEEDGYTQWTVANDVATHSRTLAELVTEDTSESVLQAIVMNPNTPSETLLRIMDLPQYYPGLGEHIVFNPNVTPDILARLADSSSDRVKMWVAKNPKTPAPVLERLARGRITARYVGQNPNAPRSLLEDLARSNDPDIRAGVATNENTPVDILERLSHDSDYNIRAWVAANSSTPEYLVRKLFNDRDISVKHAASEAGFHRGIKL